MTDCQSERALFDDLPDPRHPSLDSSSGSSKDKRDEFDKLAGKGSSIDAERAFLKNKIELLRSDPHIGEDDRARAIADLQRRLDFLSDQESSSFD